jgi:hypothetical protein
LDEYHRFREACIQAEIALESNLKDQQSSAFPLEPEVPDCLILCIVYIRGIGCSLVLYQILQCLNSSHILEEPVLIILLQELRKQIRFVLCLEVVYDKYNFYLLERKQLE